MRNLWMRAGVSLQITEEEEQTLFTEDCHTAAETFKKIISEGRFKLDGDSYIPNGAVEAYNEAYGTNYEVLEYGWDI